MALVISPELVEGAVDAMRSYARQQLNGWIDWVYENHTDKTINLPKIPNNNFYISDGIEPLTPPACFIVADESDHNHEAQNFAAQMHTVYVALLAEDIETQRLQRKVWRYGKALWLTFHDQNIGNLKVLIRRLSYGPTISVVVAQGTQRSFLKDVTVRCDVLHYEAFR